MNAVEINDALVGDQLGPFHIKKRLASGGMGTVYRARQEPIGIEVAIKVLAPTLAADQEYVARFLREAAAARKIAHPNVIRVIHAARVKGLYYLVMEYVEGPTLDSIIEKQGRLPLGRATTLARGIASGLEAAHRAGVIHRDVKPGNVIVSRGDIPHLTDFGLARQRSTRPGLTIEGTFLGTPEYASPEQVEGTPLDQRTDLYSLGVTYYQMLSGMLPFDGDSPMQIGIKRLKDSPRPLEEALPDANRNACAIVKKLLRRDPGRRYMSSTDLINDMDALLKGRRPRAVDSASTPTRGPTKLARKQAFLRMLAYSALSGWAIILAFLAGGLCAPGPLPGALLSTEIHFIPRMILLAGAIVAAVFTLRFSRSEPSFRRRSTTLILLFILMLVSSLFAGFTIERPENAGVFATIGGTARSLLDHASVSVNVLALGIVLLVAGLLPSPSSGSGSSYAFYRRISMAAGFFCFYLFGADPSALPDSIALVPVLTFLPAAACVLVCTLGIIFSTHSKAGRNMRLAGTILTVAGACAVYVFALVAFRPESGNSPTLLFEPFAGLPYAASISGTPIVVSIFFAIYARRTMVADPVRQAFLAHRK